ncbi:trans-sulfuration enzyme family protein [Idiomarina xiamenensis]|uniref:Methionine gamma-lyase n=1 Tax=Idiomarina xiamenensis 10-D-4 TaxID=740709 RepID=K2L4K9_9GAMM|nr:PLP-dependent aspartate aminotransferase family protein [Idiomarina xiamenensis]EKE84760.1 methionine gamma-lyase [Idiomarina xiamenensis 10-D-4]
MATDNNNNAPPQHSSWRLATQTIHAGRAHDDPHGALVAPLYQSATFTFANSQQGSERFAGDAQGYIYSRLGNPTVTELEQKMAVLEAAATATGMGAVSAAMLAFLKQGDHILVAKAIYGCSFALFSELFTRFGISVDFVDMTTPQSVAKAMRDNTRLLFLETPANPHLQVIDIAAIADIGHQYGARVVVDNTFMTPLFQRPREQGADIVIHSATKYLNGHGDVVAGVICGNEDDIALIKSTTLKDMGATISPHDAWLILRGLKTLDVRMQRHMQNAQQVADFLQQHKAVATLYFPGCADHPAQALMGTQMHAAGAVIAFELEGDEAQARRFLDALQLITLAVSLGDAESLIQHPASMTHSPFTPEARQAAGISDTLVRLSVGLEAIEDILADLAQALAVATAQPATTSRSTTIKHAG